MFLLLLSGAARASAGVVDVVGGGAADSSEGSLGRSIGGAWGGLYGADSFGSGKSNNTC